MHRQTVHFFTAISFLIAIALPISFLVPIKVQALGAAADAICTASHCTMTPGTPQGAPYCPQVACIDVTNGFTTHGYCSTPSHCEAVSAQGLNGQQMSTGSGSMSQLFQAAGQILGQLLQSSNSGSSDSSSGSTGCTSYTAVSDANLVATNPCFYYVPATSNSLTSTTGTTDTSQSLLDALDGGTTNTGTSISDILSQSTSTTQTTTQTNVPQMTITTLLNNNGENGSGPTLVLSSSTENAIITGSFSPNATSTSNGTSITQGPEYVEGNVSGNIQNTDTGATFSVQSNNPGSNSETAGFFGADTLVGGVQDLIAGWCTTRPWATNFLSSLFPPSFFDGLCKFSGFQVGASTTTVPQQSLVQIQPIGVQPIKQSTTPIVKQTPTTPVQTSATTSVFVVPAKVDIWAVPSSVPLDARTTIFWNTEGVSNCTETSPDGSFKETTLSGGASTVPLTQATTYSISCLDSNQNPVTGYVTVNIAI